MVPRGEIPTYTIDLSLPPSRRYENIAVDYKKQLGNLENEFDETVYRWVKIPILVFLFKIFAFLFIRRLYSAEEMEEIKGISKVSGVNVRILVALNVLLDSLMCCTSGGVLTQSENESQERMMHFRTLDWDLDSLRDMLVVLEYVESNSSDPRKVIGRSITYAGYVGILTGVRENFSISMNFRPTTYCSQLSLRFHQFLVLVGLRPSISTIFRSLIIAPIGSTLPSIMEACNRLSREYTFSPCYVILCNGHNTLIIEKDLNTSNMRSSSDFIIQANHDIYQWQLRNKLNDHDLNPFPVPRMTNPCPAPPLGPTRDHPDIFRRHQAYWNHENSQERYTLLRQNWLSLPDKVDRPRAVKIEHLKDWIRQGPINCSQTHFMCFLDPVNGQIQWLERGVKVSSD